MNKKDYTSIAKIMDKDIGITKATKTVICDELGDYFEKEEEKIGERIIPKKFNEDTFDREYFLKLCGVTR